MIALTERSRHVLAGAITIVLLTAATVIGVKAATGEFAATYRLTATFDAAGQGLLPESDVKIHGVDIGEVARVELAGGRALVHLDIEAGEDVPAASSASIRPKTLFGEKFVDIDPGADETSGPFLGDGGRIERTTGGFELERVLSDLYPILQQVDPDDVGTILSELAAGAESAGPAVNRAIGNAAAVFDVQARHNADTQRFLDDLALLSEELDRRAEDLVAGAADLNAALPVLNHHADDLATVLDQAARLSSDAADLLEANRTVTRKLVTEGGKALQHVFDQREQLPGLVRGLRQFVQLLAEVGRIELGDGTRLAAVKGILGGGPVCGRTTAGCPEYTGPPAGRDPMPASVPAPLHGADAITSLVGGPLR